MSYQKLLTDKCDLYHLRSRSVPGSYGAPDQSEHYYEALPDIMDAKSYWTPLSNSIEQEEPNAHVVETFRVHFPITLDIRMNDKVIYNGVKFKLQVPQRKRNHHWEVVARRDESL